MCVNLGLHIQYHRSILPLLDGLNFSGKGEVQKKSPESSKKVAE